MHRRIVALFRGPTLLLATDCLETTIVYTSKHEKHLCLGYVIEHIDEQSDLHREFLVVPCVRVRVEQNERYCIENEMLTIGRCCSIIRAALDCCWPASGLSLLWYCKVATVMHLPPFSSSLRPLHSSEAIRLAR